MARTRISTQTVITGEDACDLIEKRQEKERDNFTKPKKTYGLIINLLINEYAMLLKKQK